MGEGLRLIFVRHGSYWLPDGGLDDLGVCQARALARHFVEQPLRPDVIYMSPARRTIHTGEILAEAFNEAAGAGVDDLLPVETSDLGEWAYLSENLKTVLRNVDARLSAGGTVLCVSHGPNIEGWVAGFRSPSIDRSFKIGEGEAVILEFEEDCWAGVDRVSRFELVSPRLA